MPSGQADSDWGAVASRLGAASGLLTSVAALTGLSVQAGLIDTTRVRWIHHALFGISLVSTSAACVVTILDQPMSNGTASRTRRMTADGLMPAVAALLMLPRLRGGSVAHATVAALALGSHAIAASRRASVGRCVEQLRHG